MHTLESEHAAAMALARAAGQGIDAIFGAATKVCRTCGMTVDPLKHWHDDGGIRRAEDSRVQSDLQRESADYQRQEAAGRIR